jgi:type I restriction enzyme S subunit
MKNTKSKLPERWAKSKLFELAEYINGKAFKPEEWEKEGTPIIRIENLTDEKAPFNYYRDECEEKYKIVDGNLLVSWSATLDAFIWQRGSAYLNQHIFKVVPSENKVNKFFLYFLLRYSMKKLRENIHGATMQHITKPKFDNFEVIHPKEIDDQIRIARELERKMAEIEKMRQAALSQKEAIAAMPGAILRDVFPYKDGGKLPEGWRWVSLGDVSTKISKGTTPTTLGHNFVSSGIPFLRAEDIQSGAIDSSKVVLYISQKTHDFLSRSKLQPGDLLITIAGTLGRVGYIPNNSPPVNCNQAVAFVRLRLSLIDHVFACFVCQSNTFYNSLIGLKATGTISNLSLEQITESKIPLPPTLNGQIRIASELERKMAEIEKMCQAADKQLEAVEALPGAILRVAFDFEEEEAS